jgi:hypothetical protein
MEEGKLQGQTNAMNERPEAVGTTPAKSHYGTILFAEDDPMVQRVTRMALERDGYTVLVANDGAEAVQLFEENGDGICLVLLDIMMPNMNGFEAFLAMRKLRPDVKALFMTGYSDNLIKRYFALENNTTLLQKPVPKELLLSTVQGLLDGTAEPEEAADFAPGTAPWPPQP